MNEIGLICFKVVGCELMAFRILKIEGPTYTIVNLKYHKKSQISNSNFIKNFSLSRIVGLRKLEAKLEQALLDTKKQIEKHRERFQRKE